MAQYLQDTGGVVPPGTEFILVGEFTNHQRLLMEIRDKLCGGNGAELARQLGKDSTYVTRLFYPADKAGRKGIGLEIMEAANRAFYLPPGFWDMTAPALDAAALDHIAFQVQKEWKRLGEDGGPRRALEQLTKRLDASHWEARQSEADPNRPPPLHSKWTGGQDPTPPYLLNDQLRVTVQRPQDAAPALQPILAWDFEEELPAGEFVMVPRLEVKLSAGPGSGGNQLEFSFDDAQLRAYSADWIRKLRLKPNKLRVMKGNGRSMEPAIFDGDDLLINLAETEIVDGRVYALWYEGGERVKRLYRMPGGGLRIRSDNDREFPEIVLGPEYTGHVRIIGRVIDRSGPGGL
jgi:phage repressor protein C with HTH and peptisase S24 domain